MADTTSPKVTLAEENLPTRLLHSDREQALSRKWWCPRDHTIGAYVDGVLPRVTKAWLELHLSGCQRCRLLVGDIVKAQRQTDRQAPSVQVIQKAIRFAERRSRRRPWVWAPAGALAAVAMLAIFVVVLRKPQQLVIVSPPAPSAPVIAKSEPPPVLHTPVKNLVRKYATPELLPTIISPQRGTIMRGERLQFRWERIPQSRNYEVRVVRADGDLVWKRQTDKSALQLPAEVRLEDGSYFVWITAYLENGRTTKSAPVRFLVQR